MADPVIPNVPSSLPADQAAFFKAMKASIEYLMGQGRTPDEDRALRVKELEALGIDISRFLSSSAADHYVITQPTSSTGRVPLPPTNLVITKGAFVHTLTWDIPDDPIVWYIEIWVAENSQSRDDAELVGIYTVIDRLRGEQGLYKHSGFNVTNDYTYWIRSMSYGYKYSPWCPIDAQGGYVVVGDESVQETVSKVLEILQGEITEDQLYQDLSSRIDLIDASGTGLIDRVSTLETNLADIQGFDQNSTYAVDDVVKYDPGSGIKIYLCTHAITTTPAPLPTDTSYWEQIGESASLAGNIAANATAISYLDTRVGTNETDISSQAALITGLRSDVDGNAADLVSEQTARANADSSLSSDITAGIATANAYTEAWSEEGADVTANSAAFLAEQTARADGDSANATAIGTVQTTVNGHTTAIETNLTSINGIQGKYAVKIDNNGYVTGFGLISTDNDGTPTSEFILLVDKFKVVTPGDTPTTPFVIGLVDGVSTVGIDGNLVIDGTLRSPAIEADAVKSAHIDTNEVFVGMTVQSSDYVSGSQGWKINGTDGIVEFNDMVLNITYNDISGSKPPVDADKTSDNVAYDTSYVNGTSASTVRSNAAAGATFTSSSYLSNTQASNVTSIMGGRITTSMIQSAGGSYVSLSGADIYLAVAGRLMLGSTNAYMGGVGGGLFTVATGNVTMTSGSYTCGLYSAVFRPSSNASMFLGYPGYQWNEIYSTGLTVNGTDLYDTLDDLDTLHGITADETGKMDPLSLPKELTSYDEAAKKLKDESGDLITDEEIEEALNDPDQFKGYVGIRLHKFVNLVEGAVRQLDKENSATLYEILDWVADVDKRISAIEQQISGNRNASMTRFLLMPYVEVDGIRTAADSDVKKLFTRTEDDALVPIIFYEGTIKNSCDFLAMAKSQGTLFYILIDGTETVGYAWLNRVENRTARLHFCVFKSYWGKSLDLGKHVLKTLTSMKSKDGEYLFDLLTGFVPVWNKHAIDFSLRCGAKTHGTIPNSIYNKSSGKSEPAVFIYYEREK